MSAATVETRQEALKALSHPLRIQILGLLKDAVRSPGDLAVELGLPLGVVSYHVRMLRDYGCVELVRTEPRRGALQHFYKATKVGREMNVLSVAVDVSAIDDLRIARRAVKDDEPAVALERIDAAIEKLRASRAG